MYENLPLHNALTSQPAIGRRAAIVPDRSSGRRAGADGTVDFHSTSASEFGTQKVYLVVNCTRVISPLSPLFTSRRPYINSAPRSIFGNGE